MPRESVRNLVEGFGQFGDLADLAKTAASHLTDFEPPLYNVWKQQTKTPGGEHFGNTEVRWVALYVSTGDVLNLTEGAIRPLYTSPGETY